ncbi:hypothetical protein CP973_11455 [Streptomyces albofaciens JCM 4342]|uniref:hypothetical protein n=1 Tax=Streptomyces albofaciens TaxID=66866 RepID=UPI00123C407A|nr:hypothetical protein [Streptomyces albofaciens]KAA6222476.1 hypothetical protein CP973_11455 [Streptomyces albofaciens JCM 4342]
MSGVGHPAPPGPAAAHAPLPLALGMPDRNSWLILIGFLVALVLILWLIGRAVRKQGGFRRACRRIAWEVRMTARAFTAPLRAYRRHRRCARTLAAYFADPAAYATSRAALDRADADAGDGCYAPAVQLAQTRDRVRVVVAGRDPAGAAGPALPWTDASGEPGEWTWSAPADAVRGPAGHGRAVRLPLVLGVDRRTPGVVLVDWLRGPAALGVEGDPQVSRSVLQALAAQVDRMPDGPPVLITAGVHPRFPGRPLDDVLAELAAGIPGQRPEAQGPDAQDPDATAVPVVVCWAPAPEQAARLADLCARGRARALVGGRLPGACWVLHAEPDGRLLGPGPRVDVESPALGPAVARAVRRRQPAPYCVLPGAGMATGPGTDTGTGATGPVPAQADLRKPAPAPEPEPAPVRQAQPAPDLRKPEPAPDSTGPQSSPDFAGPQSSLDSTGPQSSPDFAEPVREPAAAVRPPEPETGPTAPPQAARRDGAPRESAALSADFAEPEPEPGMGTGTSAPAPAQSPAPAQPSTTPAHRPAEASPAPASGTASASGTAPAPGADFAEPDFAEPDLAEPGSAAAPPGLAGVSAAGTSEADSDPAPGDPQERTPRTP